MGKGFLVTCPGLTLHTVSAPLPLRGHPPAGLHVAVPRAGAAAGGRRAVLRANTGRRHIGCVAVRLLAVGDNATCRVGVVPY